MLASLIYDTSRRKLWTTNGALFGLDVDGIPLDVNDLAYARHRLDNPLLDLPPARGDYLRYRCLLEIEKSGPLTLAALCPRLGIKEGDRQKRVEWFLQKSVKEGFLEVAVGIFSMQDRYRNTWPRIRKFVVTLGPRMCEE